MTQKKPNKALIFLAVLGILGGLALTISMFIQSMDNGDENPSVSDEVNNAPDTPVAMLTEDGEDDPSFNEGKPTLDKATFSQYKERALRMVRRGEIEDALEMLDEQAERYAIDNDDAFNDLRIDIGGMVRIKNERETPQPDTTIIELTARQIKTPELFVYQILSMPYRERYLYFAHGDSLVMTYVNSDDVRVYEPSITYHDEEVLDVPHEVGILYEDAKAYHKFELTVEGLDVDAYVIEFNDGSLRFHRLDDASLDQQYSGYRAYQLRQMDINREADLPILQGLTLDPIKTAYTSDRMKGEE